MSPVVVGAVGVALEGVVRVAEEGHAIAAVEDFSANPIGLHVLEALARVPTARAAHGIAAAGELFVFLGWDAGVAKASGIEGAEAFTDDEVPGLPLVFVNEVWGSVPEFALHASRPQIGWLEHVGIG